MKSLFYLLPIALLFSCKSEPKDCKTLIHGEWILVSHAVNTTVFRSNFPENFMITDGTDRDTIQKRIVNNFVKANSAIGFTADGKYQHTDLNAETTYTLTPDCKLMRFEMSPGHFDTLVVMHNSEKKLTLEYNGITLEYKRQKEKG